MASAVFPGRSGQQWGGAPANPTSKPWFTGLINPNSSYNFNRHDNSSQKIKWQHFNGMLPVPAPESCSQPMGADRARPGTIIGCRDLFRKEYVAYNLASYSRMQLYELKQRIVSDLFRVRRVLKRMETRELECGPPPTDSQCRKAAPKLPVLPMLPPCLQVSQNYALNNLNQKQALNAANELGTLDKPSGTKRGCNFTSDRDCKRPAVKRKGSKISDQIVMNRCKLILHKLMVRKHAWIFNKPVDAKSLKLHDYNLIIKHPMDLGTVKSKLSRNEYATPQDFAADVRLTFNNALVYNHKGEQVYALAELFLKNFENMLKTVAPQKMICDPQEQNHLDRKSKPSSLHSMVVNPPVSNQALKYFPHHIVSPISGKMLRPVVKDQNKRNMTFKEKAKLGLSLQNLPQEKMEHALQIIMKRNISLPEEGGEIDLDIEVLDIDTLWELDRFVNSQKNSLGNVKMQYISELPKGVPIPQHKGDDVEEEEVDIGEEVLNSDFPTVEIEKDDVCGTSSSTMSNSSSYSSSGESGNSSGSASEDSVRSPYIEPKKLLISEL